MGKQMSRVIEYAGRNMHGLLPLVEGIWQRISGSEERGSMSLIRNLDLETYTIYTYLLYYLYTLYTKLWWNPDLEGATLILYYNVIP